MTVDATAEITARFNKVKRLKERHDDIEARIASLEKERQSVKKQLADQVADIIMRVGILNAPATIMMEFVQDIAKGLAKPMSAGVAGGSDTDEHSIVDEVPPPGWLRAIVNVRYNSRGNNRALLEELKLKWSSQLSCWTGFVTESDLQRLRGKFGKRVHVIGEAAAEIESSQSNLNRTDPDKSDPETEAGAPAQLSALASTAASTPASGGGSTPSAGSDLADPNTAAAHSAPDSV